MKSTSLLRIGIAVITPLSLFAAPAAADPAFDVSVGGFATSRAGIGGGLQGWGTTWGPEWDPSGSTGAASASFSSTATCCETPDIHGNVAPGAALAHADFNAAASWGRLSAAANANVSTTAPIDFPGWGYYVEAYAGAGAGWTDTLTVNGAAIGTPVTVRMTVSLEDTIGAAYSGEGLNSWYGSHVFAGRSADTTDIDAESGAYQTAEVGLDDWSGRSTGLPQQRSIEFSEQVGIPFAMSGSLDILVHDILASNGVADGTWAYSFVDASHTMKGNFEIVNPLPGQSLSSASGHVYAAAVPEPRNWALMLAGLTLLGVAGAGRKTTSPLARAATIV